jgi:hypothetical protein
MTRIGRRCNTIFVLVTSQLACTMPPAGGVSGTVAEASGKPLAGVEVTLTYTPRMLGVAVPFAEHTRIPTATDESGYFRVLWPHGDRYEGPLLELNVAGYAPVAERRSVSTILRQFPAAFSEQPARTDRAA